MPPTEPIPVFVFLDENIAHMDGKIEDFLEEKFPEQLTEFSLFFFPFPTKSVGKGQEKNKSRGKGKTDYEVTCFVKKIIFSDKYIKSFLCQNLDPWFIFLTRDRNFIKDVVKEMKKDSKRVDGTIVPLEDVILFTENKVTTLLSVVCVYHKPNIRKNALVAAAANTLKDFLNTNLLADKTIF